MLVLDVFAGTRTLPHSPELPSCSHFFPGRLTWWQGSPAGCYWIGCIASPHTRKLSKLGFSTLNRFRPFKLGPRKHSSTRSFVQSAPHAEQFSSFERRRTADGTAALLRLRGLLSRCSNQLCTGSFVVMASDVPAIGARRQDVNEQDDLFKQQCSPKRCCQGSCQLLSGSD